MRVAARPAVRVHGPRQRPGPALAEQRRLRQPRSDPAAESERVAGPGLRRPGRRAAREGLSRRRRRAERAHAGLARAGRAVHSGAEEEGRAGPKGRAEPRRGAG